MSDRSWQGPSTGNSAEEERRDSGETVKARRHPSEKLIFTQEELKVLQECNTESFYYRCVPLGILFVGATQILTNKGILKPHPRFGALFKNLGASLAAFVLGKISYQSTCKEKIMRLPNSALAESMRRGISPIGISEDIEKPQDMYKPPSADFKYDEPQQKRNEPLGGYDALRQQNRQEYDRRRNYQQPPTKPAETQQNQEPPKDDFYQDSKFVKRNKYGDVVD